MTGLEALRDDHLRIGLLALKRLFEANKGKISKDEIMAFDFTFMYITKSLKALEIIKEKNVNMFGFKRDIKQLGNRFTYKYYQSNLGNYHSGFDIQELTEEEFNTLKAVLE